MDYNERMYNNPVSQPKNLIRRYYLCLLAPVYSTSLPCIINIGPWKVKNRWRRKKMEEEGRQNKEWENKYIPAWMGSAENCSYWSMRKHTSGFVWKRIKIAEVFCTIITYTSLRSPHHTFAGGPTLKLRISTFFVHRTSSIDTPMHMKLGGILLPFPSKNLI